MSYKIQSDVNRFKDIIRNKVKNNLKKFATSEKIIGQQGKDIVSIPIDRIDLPRFIFGSGAGGAGQGDGNIGDPIDGKPKSGEGNGKAGKDPGEHQYIAEFTPDELAQILGEELQLPKLENKAKGKVNSVKDRYTGIAQQGPEGLRHFKRTYKEALKRNIASGTYDPKNPKFIPIKDDKRYRSVKYKEEPDTNTVIIYMMDVSGSMGDKEKHLVKSEVFWIDLWLKSQYKNIESVFLVHDSNAHEVTREEFFKINTAGGTVISSAYELCAKIMREEFPYSDWNVYAFHFSDGDNGGDYDNDKCKELLSKEILPNCNLFGYGQVLSKYGDFHTVLEDFFQGQENLLLSKIDSSEEIFDSIKTFFGKGK